jgi:hypothetical protein
MPNICSPPLQIGSRRDLRSQIHLWSRVAVTAEAYLLFTLEICHIVVAFWFFNKHRTAVLLDM